MNYLDRSMNYEIYKGKVVKVKLSTPIGVPCLGSQSHQAGLTQLPAVW